MSTLSTESTRICYRCKQQKPITNFRLLSGGKRRGQCRTCWRQTGAAKNGRLTQKHSASHRVIKSKQNIRKNKRKSARNKVMAFEYKGGRCQNPSCPLGKQQLPIIIYDYHHLDPTIKDTEMSKLWHHSWGRVKAELDKCILYCCVCHRLAHAGLLRNNKNGSSSLGLSEPYPMGTDSSFTNLAYLFPRKGKGMD